jgi:hypothetical protein
MSIAHKGRKLSEETITKCVLAQAGYKHSEETKAKISVAQKGRSFSEQHLARVRAAGMARRGSHHSMETKLKIRSSLSGRTDDDHAKDGRNDYYVYVWRHRRIPRYVGMSCVERHWKNHLRHNAAKPEKSAYFQQHGHESRDELREGS